MTRGTKIGVAVVAVAVIGLIGVNVVQSKKKKAPAVTIEKVERTDLKSLVTATGKIEAQRKVDLSANVMGQIVNLAVREGDVVEKGAFLLQIDQTQRQATALSAEESLKALFFDRDAARARAEEAQKAYERVQRSFADELVPQADVDTAKASFDAAEANVKAVERRIEQARATLAGARDELSKTKMTSPMGGLVTALPVEEGEIAVIGTMNNAGTKLMTISDMSVVEAVMEVDETDVPNVRVGQTAEVRIDAFADQKFTGIVTEVGSSPIQTSGDAAVNFEVKIQLDEPPAGIRPGFSCSADILTGTAESVVAIPIQALVVRDKPQPEGEKAKLGEREEEEGVYLFQPEESTIKFQPVVPGMLGQTMVEIVSGLDDGQEIVTGPFKALREIKDGDKVRREEPKKKGDGEKKD